MFGLVVLASACARTGPPPGGPADTTAPELLSAAPESAAVGVDPGATLELIFSEKVDPNTVERALWITPAPGKLKVDVSGDRVSVRPEDGFPPDATIGILVTTALKDRMRERPQTRMEAARRWTFATADSLDAGSVSGTVSRKGQRPESGQLLVALYPGDADTLPDPRETDPIAVTEADASDRFVLEGLPTDGKRRWLIALFDRDENRIIGGPGEFASALPETLVLTSRVQSRNVSLELIDPAAPGRSCPGS